MTRLAMACLLATALWLAPAHAHQQAASKSGAQSADKSSPTEVYVSLTIDFGDGMQKRYPEIRWVPGNDERVFTVGDALKFATSHPRGINTETRGEGATMFLTSIDGVENEGAGGRNWMFSINGKLGKSSFALAEVPRDADILWEFRRFR